MSKKERKRMCLNCRHRVIRGASDFCDIDDHYMHYSEVFEGWCKHWAKEPGLIPIDEVILVNEASLNVPYHDIKTAYEYIKRHAEMWNLILPPGVSDLLSRWEEFLAENY